MIFTKALEYLPYEQPNKGGPFFLKIIRAGTEAGEYEVPADAGNIYLILRLKDSAPESAFAISFAGNARTWDNRIAGGSNIWNGRVAMLYIENHPGGNIELSGAFGGAGAHLEWLAAAIVIGAPVFPSRIIDDPDVDFARQVTPLTSGRVKVTQRSDDEIFAGKIKLQADKPEIGETFRTVNAEGECVIFPCGLDPYAEGILPVYRRPGWARRIAITKLVGPSGYGGGLDAGEAVNASLSFRESP